MAGSSSISRIRWLGILARLYLTVSAGRGRNGSVTRGAPVSFVTKPTASIRCAHAQHHRHADLEGPARPSKGTRENAHARPVRVGRGSVSEVFSSVQGHPARFLEEPDHRS